MKKAIQIIILAGLLFNIVQGQQKHPQENAKTLKPRSLTAEQIAKKYLPSVVLLVCDDGKGTISQGSGFFIRPGELLTNYHVVKGMVRGQAKVAVGGKEAKKWWIEKLIYTDPRNDLALLYVDEADVDTYLTDLNGKVLEVKIDGFEDEKGKPIPIPKKPYTPTLRLSNSDLITVGEAIYVLSNPEGLIGTISRGIVSGETRKFKDINLLQIDAPISYGSSGGAVLNSHGEVIGIATASLKNGQNFNFAIPSSQIKLFLASCDTRKFTFPYKPASTAVNSWIKETPWTGSGLGTGQGSGRGTGSSSSTSNTQKTELDPNKPIIFTYETATKFLIEQLQNASASDRGTVMKVKTIGFSGCEMNYSFFMTVPVAGKPLEANVSVSANLRHIDKIQKHSSGGFFLDFDEDVILAVTNQENQEEQLKVREIPVMGQNPVTSDLIWTAFHDLNILCKSSEIPRGNSSKIPDK